MYNRCWDHPTWQVHPCTHPQPHMPCPSTSAPLVPYNALQGSRLHSGGQHGVFSSGGQLPPCKVGVARQRVRHGGRGGSLHPMHPKRSQVQHIASQNAPMPSTAPGAHMHCQSLGSAQGVVVHAGGGRRIACALLVALLLGSWFSATSAMGDPISGKSCP